MTSVFITVFSLLGLTLCYWQIRERSNIKALYYGNPVGHYPNLYVRTCSCAKCKAEAITEKEHKLFEALRKTERKGLWGESVHRALESRDVEKRRQLVIMLRDQLRDAPVRLREWIGEEAFQILIVGFGPSPKS